MKNKLFILFVLLTQIFCYSQEITKDIIASKELSKPQKIDFDALIVIDGKISNLESLIINTTM